MSSTTGGHSDLQAIGDLLRSGQEAQEDRYEAAVAREKMLTPGSIGPPPNRIGNESRLDPKAIWTEDEASEAQDPFYDPDDPRPQPEYDIVYKQSVMTEDAFLGMAGKTPGSKDCTHIVVKIVFPGCRKSDLDVDVTRSSIMAASPKLRLATCLPHPVDEAQGDATWNPKTFTLAVTLPIIPGVW